MNAKQLPVNKLVPLDELMKIAKRLEKAKEPTPDDIQHFRQLAVSTPALWPLATEATNWFRRQLIEKMGNGILSGCLLAELDILKKQFGFDTAPPIERLLIEHILTARLRLIHAEQKYNECVVNQSITFREGEYWDNLLSSTQARFLRAIESLARVRRLARNTPALQINIAREGGKQVNVQGSAPIDRHQRDGESHPRGSR